MIDQVLLDQPRVRAALQAVRVGAASHGDADLLAMAELRMCQLLGAEPPAGSGLVDPTPHELAAAVVAFVEQWVIDVSTVTDEMIAALRAGLGEDRLMDFVHGVLAIEQRIRLELAWSRLGLGS